MYTFCPSSKNNVIYITMLYYDVIIALHLGKKRTNYISIYSHTCNVKAHVF